METFKECIIIIQLAISIIYVGCVTLIFGILPSVSDSFLELQKKFGNKTMLSGLIPWVLFWGYVGTMGTSVYIFVNFSGWGFLSMCGLMLVGAAAQIDRKSVQLPHGIGAVVGIIVAFIGLSIYGFQIGVWYAFIPAVLQLLLMWFLSQANQEVKIGYTGDMHVIKKPVQNYVLWIELSALFLIAVTEFMLL